MKYLIITFLSLFFSACSSDYRQIEILLPNGQKQLIEIKRTIDNDSLIIDEYKSGQTFLKLRKFKIDTSNIMEAFFFYDTGSLMDYKVYINNGSLKFYSRYNLDGKIIQLNGNPIFCFDDDTILQYVTPNIGLVSKNLTFTPPKTVLKSWLDGNECEDPFIQISTKADSLRMTIINEDTLGYIYSVTDTIERRIPILWSIEDSLSGEILKTGLLVHKYKAKNKNRQ